MHYSNTTSLARPLKQHWKRGITTGIAFAAFLVGPTLSAQDLPFDSGSTGNDGPLDIPFHIDFREDFGIAYDETRQEAVLFSGRNGGTYYADTWTFDPTSGVWTQKSPATFVSARANHSMVYDPTTQSVILFGGLRSDGVRLNDMWRWNGTDWSQITPATSPTPREDAVMAVNPASGEMLLFGGYNGTHLNDTWFWDGTDWSLVSTTTTPGQNYSNYRQMVFQEDLGLWLMYNEWSQKTWTSDGTDWTELTTGGKPNVGERFGMAYDAANDEVVIFGGSALDGTTWVYANGDWFQRSPSVTPNRRRGHGMFYNPDDGLVYATLGDVDNYFLYTAAVWSTQRRRFSTYAWDGTTWAYRSGWLYTFDLGAADDDGDGVWDFTTITVPSWVQVRFRAGPANNIVRWRASGDVLINGYLLVDGQDAPDNTGAGLFAAGGPGGGAGGVGGINFLVSGSLAGTGGIGPGGGTPGVAFDQDGAPGQFFGVYGNSAQQPVLAGSGGGGGASNNQGAGANGGNGGGGGGGIIIESSGDITVNGGINADGGRAESTGNTWGGTGSGGGVVLRADRVLGSGFVWARGGRSITDNRAGRIRIEAFYRPLASNASPQPSATAPVASIISGAEPVLSIISIDGALSVQPPTGNQLTPDVVFADNQPVVIVVEGTNIPVGTPVTLRITGSGTIIELPLTGDPDVTLDASGLATFTATVPAGVGTVQAFASFTPATP